MKLLSGGQSGVDRAVLDVALARGIAYGGWCPERRLGGRFSGTAGAAGAISETQGERRSLIRHSARNGTCATPTRV